MDRILGQLAVCGETQRALCAFVGINEQVFTDWKAGRNKSYLKHIAKISEFLGVSVDYLLGTTDQKEKPTGAQADELSEYDARVLAWFHSLPPEKRQAILQIGGGPKE